MTNNRPAGVDAQTISLLRSINKHLGTLAGSLKTLAMFVSAMTYAFLAGLLLALLLIIFNRL